MSIVSHLLSVCLLSRFSLNKNLGIGLFSEEEMPESTVRFPAGVFWERPETRKQKDLALGAS